MVILPSGYGTLIMGYNGKTVLFLWAYNHNGKIILINGLIILMNGNTIEIRKYHADTT